MLELTAANRAAGSGVYSYRRSVAQQSTPMIDRLKQLEDQLHAAGKFWLYDTRVTQSLLDEVGTPAAVQPILQLMVFLLSITATL